MFVNIAIDTTVTINLFFLFTLPLDVEVIFEIQLINAIFIHIKFQSVAGGTPRTGMTIVNVSSLHDAVNVPNTSVRHASLPINSIAQPTYPVPLFGPRRDEILQVTPKTADPDHLSLTLNYTRHIQHSFSRNR